MLSPTGNFGKFLVVLLSLSVTANIAATFYSVSLNVQLFIPWLVAVPRYVFSLLATAVYALYYVMPVDYEAHSITNQGGSFGDRWIPQVLQHIDQLPRFDRLLVLSIRSNYPCRT